MNGLTQGSILVPTLALAGWTMIIFLLIPYRRVKAANNGELSSKDFKLGESERVSLYVALANRNYMNLLELPVLFYVACIIFFIIQGVTSATLILAWLYVAFRVAHSLVHVTYNNVLHRGRLFALSNLILVGRWFVLALPILRIGGLIA